MATTNIAKAKLDQLLVKEMDRKAFVKHVGVAALALSGVSALFIALLRTGSAKTNTHSAGYSAADYGGKSSLAKVSHSTKKG